MHDYLMLRFVSADGKAQSSQSFEVIKEIIKRQCTNLVHHQQVQQH